MQIWREGTDDEGFQLHLVLTIPHVKGRARFLTEDQRTIRKAMSSKTNADGAYNLNLDPVLFLIALAFRQEATTEDLQTWWLSDTSKLRFKDEMLEEPVFASSARLVFK